MQGLRGMAEPSLRWQGPCWQIPSFWLEACNTAAYIKNRITHKATTETPFKRWNGKIPDISNLQIFGAECLVLTPDQERQKWDMKCKPCLFLGYVEDSEYYRVYTLPAESPVASRLAHACKKY
jgi:hypothetical protein